MAGTDLGAKDVARFEEIFTIRPPSMLLPLMAELDAAGFEQFIAYVFERAGYTVQKIPARQGVDLFLFGHGKKPVGYVQAEQCELDANIGMSSVQDMQLKMLIAGVASGYLMSPAHDFTTQAKQEASKTPQLRLIGGAMLSRYIAYVRSSRDRDDDTTPISPDQFFHEVGRRDTKKTIAITLANSKGGVGKTTTALNLACGLARRGEQVLLVDLDAQANLTKLLPDVHEEEGYIAVGHVGDYFMGRSSLRGLVRRTEHKGVWLIPAAAGLGLTEPAIHARTEAELKFVSDLHGDSVKPSSDAGDFRWMILDTAPDVSLLRTRAALAAAHYVISPAEASILGHEGLNLLFDTVTAMHALMGDGVEILGCVITRWQDNRPQRDALEAIEDLLKPRSVRMFQAKIPVDANIEKAHRISGEGGTKDLYDVTRGGAAAKYTSLLEEVLEHVRNG